MFADLIRLLIRLVGAVLAEQHDEWIEGRRYLGLESASRAQPNRHAGSPQPGWRERGNFTGLTICSRLFGQGWSDGRTAST